MLPLAALLIALAMLGSHMNTFTGSVVVVIVIALTGAGAYSVDALL
ncbi:hypothetical protein [Paenibacillus lentus]|nr:hypothetical protein [Paenibacillus lentus]